MTEGRVRVALVVAMADNRVIGAKGGLPWRIPADLKHFKAVTMGKGNNWLVAANQKINARPFNTYNWK